MPLRWISAPAPTWVVLLFSWLAGTLIAELIWGESLMVQIAIVVGLVAAYGSTGWLVLSKRPLLPAEERRPWSLFAIGMLMVAGGMVIQVVASLISPSVGAFGPLDLLFLAAYGIGLTGFAMLPQFKTALISRRRLLLDGLIGAVSIAALMWIFVGEPMFTRLTDSLSWEFLIGSAYPVLDFAGFVVVMLVVLRRSNFRFDPRLMAVGFALVVQGFGDILYFRAGLGKGFLEADPLYSLHLIAAASVLAFGLIVERQPEPREFPDRDVPWLSLLAPYGAALLLVTVTAAHVFIDTRLDTQLKFLLVATSLVVVLVVLRQFLAIRENRTLLERERDALVSSISHELRTPLTAVLGYLELLTDSKVITSEEERDDLLFTTKDQAVHLSNIVADLILAARENPGAVELQRRPVRLLPLIEDVARRVDSSTQEIEVTCPDDLTVLIDPERTQQALLNLLDNARRYAGGRCLVVAKYSGRRLVLQVHDDGPGVPERHRERIWKRFERGSHRLDAARPGSGVGLALVDMIARAHGGSATYRPSWLLGGACFQIMLMEPAQKTVRLELGEAEKERPGSILA